MYSIPHFNFQREDYVRAMHLFAIGEEMTPRGLVWLAIHVANVFGFKPPAVEHVDGTKGEAVSIDKASLAERYQWTMSNYALIESTARQQNTEWLKAKKPFAALAACVEFVSALEAQKKNQPFITCLPITLDVTNSALQHQAALMRDEDAGALVNLCSQPIVYDLAGKWPWTHFDFPEWMLTTVPPDAPEDAYREILLWAQGKTDIPLDRALVKAPGMTENYGSTPFGKARQIEAVLRKRGQEPPAWTVLRRLGVDISQTIAERMPGLLPLREFLLNTASILAEVNKPMQFTTASGFPVSNRYHSMRLRRVKKPIGKRVTIADGYYPDLLAKSAKSGVVANSIHAEDASFLALVVNACSFQLASVHDSFSMLATRADEFREIARERFEWMYNNHDLLADIRKRAEAALSEPAIVDGLRREADKANARRGGAPHARLINMIKKAERALNNPTAQTLPPVPPRGNLDLRSISLDFIS